MNLSLLVSSEAMNLVSSGSYEPSSTCEQWRPWTFVYLWAVKAMNLYLLLSSEGREPSSICEQWRPWTFICLWAVKVTNRHLRESREGHEPSSTCEQWRPWTFIYLWVVKALNVNLLVSSEGFFVWFDTLRPNQQFLAHLSYCDRSLSVRKLFCQTTSPPEPLHMNVPHNALYQNCINGPST